jgi:hypothetical protein
VASVPFALLAYVSQYADSEFAETQLNLGNDSSLVGEAVDRFGGRDAQKFKFLGKYVMRIPDL